MLSRLWGWLAAAGLVMLLVIQRLAGQREEAERTAEEAKQRAAATSKQRDTSRQAQEAVNEAAQQAEEKQGDDDARGEDTRPGGSLRRR